MPKKLVLASLVLAMSYPAPAESAYPTPTSDGRQRIRRTTGRFASGNFCEALHNDTPAAVPKVDGAPLPIRILRQRPSADQPIELWHDDLHKRRCLRASAHAGHLVADERREIIKMMAAIRKYYRDTIEKRYHAVYRTPMIKFLMVFAIAAVGAWLVLSPDDDRDCSYSPVLKACTWASHPLKPPHQDIAERAEGLPRR